MANSYIIPDVTFSGAKNYYGGSGGGAYGAVPVAPPITSTQPGTTKQAMEAGNLAYNQLPKYQGSLSHIGKNINSMVKGEVPADVLRQIQQTAAERGIATGSPGGPNSNAAMLQALGLTSLQLQNQGQQNLQGILPTLPGAQISQNPGFYVSPQQQYERDLQSNIFAAAPNPALAAGVAQNAAQNGFNAGRGSVSYAGPSSMPNLNFGTTPSSTSGGMTYANPPAVGRVGYFDDTAASADPYANWSNWWTGGNPASAVASKYSGTVGLGKEQGFESSEYANPNAGYTDYTDFSGSGGDYGDYGGDFYGDYFDEGY